MGHLLRPGHPERLRTLPSPYGDGRASRRVSRLALRAADAAGLPAVTALAVTG